MALSKELLGTFIERLDNTNSDGTYGIDDVRGVSNLKGMMNTKADLTNRNLSKFSVVYPNDFVFNHRTSRNGSKFSITMNTDAVPHIFTEDYVVFRIRPDMLSRLDPFWLYMFFNRDEFDRYVIMHSWGSSTEFYNWDDLCKVKLELPDIKIQRKFVDVYKAMVANQQAYEKGLDDLKLTCDAYIEDLRREMPCQEIGPYITKKNERNQENAISKVMGLSTKKEFRIPSSRVNTDEIRSYKIVNNNDFAFVPTTDTWKVLAFAVNDMAEPIVVSPIYEVFSVNGEVLVPQYLAMWLSRTEFDRYARFNSWGSARENFSFSDMKKVSIPIPPIETQNAIVDIFHCWKRRKAINERLKAQIKDICPILIRGSIQEGKTA